MTCKFNCSFILFPSPVCFSTHILSKRESTIAREKRLRLFVFKYRYQVPLRVLLGLPQPVRFSSRNSVPWLASSVMQKKNAKLQSSFFYLERGDTEIWFYLKTGSQCCYEFCYECLVSHRNIMQKDNTAHKRSCSLHPKNLKS
jgi:hypothetical protein